MIGKLRHRITIERATETRGPTGQVIKSWATLASVWGRKETIASTETQSKSATYSTTTYRFTIRYRSGLLPTDRLKIGTAIYNITGILPDEKRKYIIIETIEG